MVNEILKLNTAISDFDATLESHISILTLAREEIIGEIEKGYSELNEIKENNAKENNRKNELKSKNSLLNSLIATNKKKLTHLESLIETYKINENKITELTNKITELTIIKDNLLSEVDIVEADKSIIMLEVDGIKNDISLQQKEYLSISESNSKINNEYLQIHSHKDGFLNLLFPFLESDINSIEIYPGCDKTTKNCKDKFFNLINYGGFPNTPSTNPAEGY